MCRPPKGGLFFCFSHPLSVCYTTREEREEPDCVRAATRLPALPVSARKRARGCAPNKGLTALFKAWYAFLSLVQRLALQAQCGKEVLAPGPTSDNRIGDYDGR